MRLLRLTFLLLLAGACHRDVGPPTVDSLVGLHLPLVPGPGVRLAVEGAVAGRKAEVQLDVAAPISVVTSGCFDEPVVTSARVQLQDPMGEDEEFPVTRVAGLVVGGQRLRTFEAAMFGHDTCLVALGTDVLRGTALLVSPDSRELRLVPSRPRATWLAEAQGTGDDVQVVTLTKDPRHDWPLLAVRVVQGTAALTATFVLSTRERDSRVFEESARVQGLKPGLELLAGLATPAPPEVPAELRALQGITYDRLELSPGYGVDVGSLKLQPGAPPRGVAGVLGVDAWGRFAAAIDVDAGVLVLRRPRLLASGARVQCDRGGTLSEEACFSLVTSRAEGGVLATGTVWRPLKEGGRLYLDVVPATTAPCRIGLTFPAGDRGRSTQHRFPWGRLFLTMKACAEVLAAATDIRLGLWEEGNLRDCPGVCAFAQDLRSGRVSCECQPAAPGQGGDAEQRFLELYRQLLEKKKPGPREQEPGGPE